MGGEVCPDARNITSILIETGTVTEDQVRAGLVRQRETGTRIGEALVELGAATEEDIGWALSRQLGIPFIDLSPTTFDRELIASFPAAVLQRLLVVPLVRTDLALSAAFGDPTDREAIAEIGTLAGLPIEVSAAAPSRIRKVLEPLVRPASRYLPGAAPARATSVLDHDHSGTRALADHLERALEAGASELHFIPETREVGVFHRVGNGLVRHGSEPDTLLFYLLARIEALGGPVIDGDDVHAAGRLSCPMGDHELSLDASLLGCQGGVAITLAFRSAALRPAALENLGLDPVDVARVRALLDPPSGLIVVAGPPRSGRSTTLATVLGAAAVPERLSLAFGCGTDHPLPATVRLEVDHVRASTHWEAIAVEHGADVIALDDVLNGESAAGMLANAGFGRLLIATTDWTDSFALLEFLMRRPGGRAVLARRLRLMIQQRRPSAGPARTGAEGVEPSGSVVFEPLFAGEVFRAAIGRGAALDELRGLAEADGFLPLARQLERHVAGRSLSAAEAARLLG